MAIDLERQPNEPRAHRVTLFLTARQLAAFNALRAHEPLAAWCRRLLVEWAGKATKGKTQ